MTDDDAAAWQAQLEQGGRVEVGYRRGKTVALAVVSVLFTLGALVVTWAAEGGGDRWVGIAGSVFFGAVAVVLLRRAASSGPAAVVTSAGVGAPGQGWTLPWEHAYGAFVFRSRGTAVVCVAVEPAWMQHHLTNAGRAMRVLASTNRRMLGLDAVSLPTPLGVDADAFARWLSTLALARPPEQPSG